MGVIRIQKTGQVFAGTHQPLVPEAVFERVQRVLNGKAPKRVIVHDFLFRRLLRCAHCGSTLIGERQKGRVYYRCHIAGCPTTTVREDVAEDHFRSLLQPLRFTAEHREQLQSAIEDFRRDELAHRKQVRQVGTLRLNNVDDRLARLTDVYLDGAIDRADFEQRKTALQLERQGLEEQVARGDSDTAVETLAEFLELACQAYLLYENAVPQERRELIEIATSNRTVDGRTPQFTLGFPFNEINMELQQQSGGPPWNKPRTRSMVRRLLNAMTSWLVDPRTRSVAANVHSVLNTLDKAA